ncbi:calcium/sodium antiporter [Candidatus Chloroploca sp. M-50]|uniref:Calcium/sodium antiporter n=1 Tax=Candidatus Chloroploca mongolica TaxID=2528176 RepID=A0ABS4D7B4_9CHLR|nr:calcium/sodium antiporter [Candidatus Chloroploca mongolica]MBP1465322.1 calcium/sodium antiporter [Candidatus Chloroploca mongolica]
MDWISLGLIAVGLVCLVIGGELLVRGASALAAVAGISPLVIGLTVVSFGTSSPELAVSLQAGLSGNADLALGNVVGSNIFNVLFILGLCALIAPLVVSLQVVRRDVPIMIGVSFLLGFLALDGHISRPEGGVLFLGILSYVTWSVISSRQETAQNQAAAEKLGKAQAPAPQSSMAQILTNIGLVLGGLIVLVLGAGWLVDGAVELAQALGVSDVVIGLTIVAVGTSLPEVVTSVIATIRNQRDLAVGNVVGSNIFNILGILGVAALVTPDGIAVPQSAIVFDIPVMIAVAVACLPIFFTRMMIARWEGFLFMGYYIAYTAYLVLAATHHEALPEYSSVMIAFVLPLTAVTLAVLAVRAYMKQRVQKKA